MAHPGSKSWVRNWYVPFLAALLAATGCSGKQPAGDPGEGDLYLDGIGIHPPDHLQQ